MDPIEDDSSPIIGDPDGKAGEFAVLVGNAWQGKGIGSPSVNMLAIFHSERIQHRTAQLGQLIRKLNDKPLRDHPYRPELLNAFLTDGYPQADRYGMPVDIFIIGNKLPE